MLREVIGYEELCAREGARLQQGMHYRLGGSHSVMLLCAKRGAPYEDRHVEKGAAIIYQGHDAPRSFYTRDPKREDQPRCTASGQLTQNGSFLKAVELTKAGLMPPEQVRVYQKLARGIWCWLGRYLLVDGWRDHDGVRHVFRFRLEPERQESAPQVERTRTIPPAVRRAVWKRDQGRCVICGATEDLHFDHIIPFSKGGCSWSLDNVQLLCSRHNLRKGASI